MSTASAQSTENTTETRTQLVSLYVRGNDADAKALYGASPGASDAGWASLERMLAPVKAFVLNGEPPYVNPYNVTTEYQGIVVPEDLKSPDEATPQATQERQSRQEPIKATAATPKPGFDEPVTGTGNSTPAPAGELVDQARRAKTKEELDKIEAQAEGRVTVLDAVAAQRKALGVK